MKKQSIYNIWVEEGDIHILYNSFSDRNIIFRKDEVENIKYYLDHTSEFEEVYPDLFRKIERLGFICDS